MSYALKISQNENNYFERTKRNHFFLGGVDVQMQLKDLKIGIAGLGGMGSNIAEYFARLGIGGLNIADFDTIDHSNINRQVIANSNNIGQKKAEASFNELISIAPDCTIKVFDRGITNDSVDEFIDGCDFIVDEIDVFCIETHKILHKKCREKKIPAYSSYVVGMGIHFYKFQGNDFKFEDMIDINKDDSDKVRLDKIAQAFMPNPPPYLKGKNLIEFKEECIQSGVPIFGPACLVGHSIVVTRVLCDFLKNKIRGVDIPPTPRMPFYLKIDLSTFQIETVEFKKA